ncbi:hypothetical protein [Chitinophaga eiseniae]|nr:hypothetical protein [Chitinophaga eiseniae]
MTTLTSLKSHAATRRITGYIPCHPRRDPFAVTSDDISRKPQSRS